MKKRLSQLVVASVLGIIVANSVISPIFTPVYAEEQTTPSQDQQTSEKKEEKNAHSGHGH